MDYIWRRLDLASVTAQKWNDTAYSVDGALIHEVGALPACASGISRYRNWERVDLSETVWPLERRVGAVIVVRSKFFLVGLGVSSPLDRCVSAVVVVVQPDEFSSSFRLRSATAFLTRQEPHVERSHVSQNEIDFYRFLFASI